LSNRELALLQRQLLDKFLPAYFTLGDEAIEAYASFVASLDLVNKFWISDSHSFGVVDTASNVVNNKFYSVPFGGLNVTRPKIFEHEQKDL
jgi:hypothetical protein